MPPAPAPEGPADRKRRQVLERLPEGCRSDFNRLCKSLLHGPAFQWLLVDAPQEGLRRQVMAALDEVLSAARLRVNRVPLGPRVPDVAALEARLVKNAAQADVVHVLVSAGWFTAERWDAFNVRRERLAQGARARLVFWLDGDAIALASQGAPDLWAWRGGVYAFAETVSAAGAARSDVAYNVPSTAEGLDRQVPQAGQFELGLRGRMEQRLAELDAWLAAHPGLDDELLVGPQEERARLLDALGRTDEALAQWASVVLPLHERRGDRRSVALTHQAVADLLARRGELSAALALQRDAVVPELERLGAAGDLADAQERLANLLEQSGQPSHALALRSDVVAPMLQRLDRTWHQAGNQGRMARLLQQLGRGDDALAAWARAEALYGAQGDAVAQTAVAAVLEEAAQLMVQRGELDQALDRLQRALAIYRGQGDALPGLWCRARIADVLQRRGQAGEAERMMAEVRAQARQLGVALPGSLSS